MRVLMVSLWYAPEPDGRVSALAEALAAAGDDVTVVTGFPNYPTGKLYPGYEIRWRQRERRNGVDILRLPLYPDHSQSAPRRAANYASFTASAAALGPWLIDRAEVVWAYTMVVGLPALWFSRLHRAPFIIDVPDLWPDALSATGMIPEGRLTRIVGVGCSLLYERADALTVWHPAFKRILVERGVPADKVEVIPNWADEDVYQPVDRDEALAEQYGLCDRFNVVFAGAMGMAQGLESVIDAALLLKDDPQVQFVLIGDGSHREELQRYANRKGTSNVRFLGLHPWERMPRFFALSDALLVHLRDDPLFAVTVPGKTVAYLACGRPVIMAVRGDGSRLVEEGGCGIACPPEDPWALAQAVRRLRAMTITERQLMGEAGRRLHRERFTKAVLLDRTRARIRQVTDAAKRR